jgi:hypothetical protein
MHMFAAFDNWIFLLLLAMAAIFRLLTKAAGSRGGGASEPDESTFPKPDQREQTPRPTSDEEQIRKFLEALGQPRTAKPPPPVTPRTDVPPRPVAPVTPPKLAPVPRRSVVWRWPEQPTKPAAAPPPLPRRYEPQRSRVPVAPAPEFEVRETTASLPEVTPMSASPAQAQIPAADQQKETSVIALLRSTRGMQGAIILREILGPPRGVEPFEFGGVA